MMTKRQESDLGTSKANRPSTTPRPLTPQQRTLIELYGNYQPTMTPQQFYIKWQVTQPQLALICCRSINTIGRWLRRESNSRYPHLNDLRQLALMDFILEHFEDMPKALLDLLCPPR